MLMGAPDQKPSRAQALAVAALLLLMIGAVCFAVERSAHRAGETVQRALMLAALEKHAAQTSSNEQYTSVLESPSARYPFLTNPRYEAHSDKTRAGQPLRGEDPFDKARYDRHVLAKLKGALFQTLPGSEPAHLRATLFKDGLSKELVRPPVALGQPIARSTALALALLTVGLLALLRRWLSLLFATVGAGSVALTGLALLTHQHLSGAAAAAAVRLGAPTPAFESALSAAWVWFAALGALFLLTAALSASTLAVRASASVMQDRLAYASIGPAMLGLAVLVGVPFVVGISLSLFSHKHGDYSFVGLDNFARIFSAALSDGFAPRTLPYALVTTLLWTGCNVVLHLSIGLFLALLLQGVAPKISKIYRVLLIVPWAVPSYLTALIWRSMFDPDIGMINRLLGLEGFSWMHQASTAFLANLITNVWLGFPFMMVVSLGALTSIPKDLYEAAEVDGASKLSQFLHITLPLLKPALLPATILGSIWTFNKFEVIYLVSEGRPDGGTDILVTEAYKWAFERGQAQGGAYGYAAAYSVIIFVVLLLYGWMTQRISKSAEEALR